MNQTTPMNTVAAGTITTMIASCLIYGATLAHITLPTDVAGSMAVLLVGGGHWLGKTLAARGSAKPAAPVQS